MVADGPARRPEELSRAISLADECARTLAPIDIEPGTADALGAPDLTSAAAAYATARTTSAHHRAQRADRLADGVARALDLPTDADQRSATAAHALTPPAPTAAAAGAITGGGRRHHRRARSGAQELPGTDGPTMSAIEALTAVLTAELPGSPGGVRALADSWRRSARAVKEAADLADAARAATTTWTGRSAEAFTTTARTLTRALDTDVNTLADGARALDLYAQTPDAAAIAAENLRRRAAHALTTAHTDPTAATATATEITTAWNTLRTTITTAATRTAALLTTTNTDTNDTADTTGDTANPRTSSGKKTDGPPTTDEKTPLSDDDIKRIARQADGSGGWGSPRQGTLNDCYLLSALQGYSRSADGSQNLRDRVNWDPDKKALVVTPYDKGEPVNVDVTDYYTNGAKDPFGKPTIMSIYERAYGIHYGDKNLDDGGTGAEAMEAISGEETHSVHTFGFTWGFTPWQQHQYTEDEWNDIKK